MVPRLEHTPRRRAGAALPITGLVIVLFALLGACSTPPSPSPSPSPTPTVAPSPSAAPSAGPASPSPISSAQEAAMAVLAADPRFAGLRPKNPDLIGQCCFYTAAPAASGDGYDVVIEIG